MNRSSNLPEAEIGHGLRALAAEPSSSRPLPDPHLLWLKAQIEERAERRERVLLPIAIAERVALAVFALLGGMALFAGAEWIENSVGQLSEPDLFGWAVAGVCLLAIGYRHIVKPLLVRD